MTRAVRAGAGCSAPRRPGLQTKRTAMNKSDIVRRVAAGTGLGKSEAEGAVDTVFETITEALAKEETVRIAGFGTFSTRHRDARTGRNPRTGERVTVPPSKIPAFKAGKGLRDAVKTGRTQPSAARARNGENGQRVREQTVARLDTADWPGGVEPVWTMLDAESDAALRVEPLAANGAVRLADDLSDRELDESAFARNALVLLGEAAGKDMLSQGSHGNLMMKCVTRLRALMSWPGMEATEHFRAGKTYREQAIGELHLLRQVVERAGLLRSDEFWFEPTSAGRAMLEPGARGALQALLFRQAFRHMDLSKYVSDRPRGLPGWWPQGDIGIVLWSLSAVGDEWRNTDTLTTLCTVPDGGIPTAYWNPAATMFARHILDPLQWFGLVECRLTDFREGVLWRKTSLFDRFLSFDVRLDDLGGPGH